MLSIETFLIALCSDLGEGHGIIVFNFLCSCCPDNSSPHSTLITIIPADNSTANSNSRSNNTNETSPLRLSTFNAPRTSGGAINRDREDHSRSSSSTSIQRRRAVAAATSTSARENITSAVGRNSIGLRRRQLFSAALQTRAQRLRGEGHNERRLLR